MTLFAGIIPKKPPAAKPAKGPSRAEQFRDAQRVQKNTAHAATTVITIPPCADKKRRKRLERDDIKWLMFYFGEGCGLPDPFTYRFTPQQREIIAALRHAIIYGGDQAIAASRGEGKTTIVERLLLKFVLTGEVDYAILFGSTAAMADNSLDTTKQSLSDNDRIAADYPEVCTPVRELHDVSQRAKTQKANGFRHDNGKPFEMAALHYSWCGQELIFPATPGSPSAGAVIATRGLDSAVRGLKRRGKRPKIAVIDDPDTEETARSADQAAKLERRIDSAIGGLGGQRRAIGRVMITTLQSRTAVSYRYTDPKQKPSFKGRRYRFLIHSPTRLDLWEEYVSLRQLDMQRRDDRETDLDPFARRAHRFYLDNRADMDAGAIVSNPHRFNDSDLPDGSRAEASALQHYFNQVADKSPEYVATELDNDPPEESALTESDLTPLRIQRQVSGLGRRVIPAGATVLTMGIDVRKVALHWIVRAWLPNGTGHTIDYGVHEIYGTVRGSDIGVDAAVTAAICQLMDRTRATIYATPEGQTMPVDLALIDAAWKTDAVYAACLTVGNGLMPVMGFGKSSGCTQANFHDVLRQTVDKKPGDGWFLSRQPRLWLVAAEADRWKTWEHDRWLTDADQPGAMHIFGQESADPERLSEDQKGHATYAAHICAEYETEEFIRGTMRRVWRAKSKDNHWLDSSYYANVAANIRGIKIAQSAAALKPTDRKPIVIPPHMRQRRPNR